MRKGPEDVPAQNALIALLIIGKIVLVLGVIAALNDDIPALSLTTQVVSWSATVGLLTALALQIRGHFSRFIPTLGAILGSDFLLVGTYGLIFLTVRITGIEVNPGVGDLFNKIFQLWTIFVVGFIMHRALNLNIGLGIVVGLVIMMFSLSISSQVASLT